MSTEPAAAKAPRERRNRTWVPDLVRQIQRGDRLAECYERLFREYEPALRKLLLIRRCPESEVDDLVQEILLRVFRGIGSFRFDSSFDTWILFIMSNTWKNFLRSRSAVHPLPLDDILTPNDDSGPAVAEPAAPGKSPLELTLAAERRRYLGAALDELPQRMRQCVLFQSYGYKIDEIAQAQGVSVATVKKQVQLGRQRLRNLDPLIELFVLSVIMVLLLR